MRQSNPGPETEAARRVGTGDKRTPDKTEDEWACTLVAVRADISSSRVLPSGLELNNGDRRIVSAKSALVSGTFQSVIRA